MAGPSTHGWRPPPESPAEGDFWRESRGSSMRQGCVRDVETRRSPGLTLHQQCANRLGPLHRIDLMRPRTARSAGHRDQEARIEVLARPDHGSLPATIQRGSVKKRRATQEALLDKQAAFIEEGYAASRLIIFGFLREAGHAPSR